MGLLNKMFAEVRDLVPLGREFKKRQPPRQLISSLNRVPLRLVDPTWAGTGCAGYEKLRGARLAASA